MARVVLVDPKAPRRTTQGRAKTDRIDARALARLLAAGFFAEVWAPDEATRARRRLTSRRAQLVHQRTREKNQVHAVLYRGLVARPSMSDIFGVAGRRWLSTLELPPDEQLTLAGCLRQIDALNGEIAAVEREIARRVLDSPEMRRLLTIPGVNAVSACALVGAIGDVSRFASSRQLVAYLGLDPRVEQSGPGPARHGRISKQGPGRARHVLVEAAWHLARSAGPLRAFHERVRARLRGQRGHRRRGAQAGGDLLAHAAPRRGLRLRPPGPHAPEDPPPRADDRRPAPARASPRAGLLAAGPARGRARARGPGRDRLPASDERLAAAANEGGCGRDKGARQDADQAARQRGRPLSPRTLPFSWSVTRTRRDPRRGG